MSTSKSTARRLDQAQPVRTNRRTTRSAGTSRFAKRLKKPRWNRLPRANVRAPKVRATAPTPEVYVTAAPPSVQVEAPSVQIQAPQPVIIPPPIVHVDVEAQDQINEASLKGLRKELQKCLKQTQQVELVLASNWGENSRQFRIGDINRVDEGIVELRMCSTSDSYTGTILIPLNQIVAVIPILSATTKSPEDQSDQHVSEE